LTAVQEKSTPSNGHPWPMISDYCMSLPDDVIAGEQRRKTTQGQPIADGSALEPPLVSVITVVFNNETHLDRAMQSVFSQTYPNIEYILIDGGSTDGTVDVIRRHSDRLSYWHSRKDKGISDAFNSGVALARGKYVALVNSDDWMEPDQVANAVAALEETGADFVFGDLVYHEPSGQPLFRARGDAYYKKRIRFRMPIMNHPTVVASRDTYEKIGLFDLEWKVAMDYDWLLRVDLGGRRGVYAESVCGHMALAGISDAQWDRSYLEVLAILKAHGIRSWKALCHAGYAITKGKIRRVAEKAVGQSLILRLRPLFNRALHW